jgi:hypothetical protein
MLEQTTEKLELTWYKLAAVRLNRAGFLSVLGRIQNWSSWVKDLRCGWVH